MNTCKAELRKKYKSVRSAVKSADKDDSIFRKFSECVNLNDVDTVFIYCSMGSEVDTSAIIAAALEMGIVVAVPRCSDRNGSMDFFIITDTQNQLIEGMYSIMEPDPEKCVEAEDSANSICIVPGLAFDKNGYRIGYGKGYYDRFLSNFKGKSIGLCYKECLCDTLPFDKYDCKVNVIITDNEIISIR